MINSSKNAKQHANYLHHSTGRGPDAGFASFTAVCVPDPQTADKDAKLTVHATHDRVTTTWQGELGTSRLSRWSNHDVAIDPVTRVRSWPLRTAVSRPPR